MTKRIIGVMAMLAVLVSLSVHAQTTAVRDGVPRIISYQGFLAGAAGAPVSDGTYRIVVSFYSDESGGSAIWRETYATEVRGGVFAIDIGGTGKMLPGQETFDHPVWVGIALDGSEEMRPLTRLTASPYALSVPDQSIGTAKLADGAVTADKVSMPYVSEIRVNGEKIGEGGPVNITGGKDVDVRYDRGSGSIVIGRPATLHAKKEGDASGLASSDGVGTDSLWSMSGDGWIDNVGEVDPTNNSWIGTSTASGGANFTVKVNSQRVMMYQPNGTTTPNIVGGFSGNAIDAGVLGSVIAGGGSTGAGLSNAVSATSTYGVIGGGVGNVIDSTEDAVIGGGARNLVERNGHYSSILGGAWNTVDHAQHAAIAGGSLNYLGYYGGSSFIGAGTSNRSDGASTVIGGGDSNAIGLMANFSVIGGGRHDTIRGNSDFNVIGGGTYNKIDTLSDSNVIDGGSGNLIDGTYYAAIGGGQQNTISGLGNNHAVIGGGKFNVVDAATATISGGSTNELHAVYGAIGGGNVNVIDSNSNASVIAGGNANRVYPSSWGGVVSGGFSNEIGANASAGDSTIYGVIGGGTYNIVYDNADYGIIGGGTANRIATGGKYATIIGGEIDSAQSYGQVVMGVWNQAKGNVPYRYNGGSASTYNDPLVIVGNGSPNGRSNAFEVSYNGHSVVYDRAGQGTTVYRGATYTDNILYAWGDVVVDANGTITNTCLFGSSVVRRGAGWYRVTMQINNPDETHMIMSCGSVVASLSTGAGPVIGSTPPPAQCQYNIRTSRIGQIGMLNVFDIFITSSASGFCDYVDAPFQFHVTGRPDTE